MKSTSHGIVDLAHEVGQEEDGALEDADEQQVAVGVVAGDLLAERRDPRCLSWSGWTSISPMRGSRMRRQVYWQRRRAGHRGSTPRSSTTTRAPSPRSSAPAPSASTSSRRAGGARAEPAGGVLGQAAQDEPGERGRQRGELSPARCGRGRRAPCRRPRRGPRPRRAGARRCGGRWRRRARRPRAAPSSRPSRTRARAKRGSDVRRVLAPGQAVGLAVGGASLAGDARGQQRAHEAALDGRHPQQRAAAGLVASR